MLKLILIEAFVFTIFISLLSLISELHKMISKRKLKNIIKEIDLSITINIFVVLAFMTSSLLPFIGYIINKDFITNLIEETYITTFITLFLIPIFKIITFYQQFNDKDKKTNTEKNKEANIEKDREYKKNEAIVLIESLLMLLSIIPPVFTFINNMFSITYISDNTLFIIVIVSTILLFIIAIYTIKSLIKELKRKFNKDS